MSALATVPFEKNCTACSALVNASEAAFADVSARTISKRPSMSEEEAETKRCETRNDRRKSLAGMRVVVLVVLLAGLASALPPIETLKNMFDHFTVKVR